MKHYTTFHAHQFEERVKKSLKSVATILDTSRQPKLAADQEHVYDDKYALVEFLTNTSMAALWNVLERLGVNEEGIAKLQQVVQEDKRSLTLRFAPVDTCSFVKEEVVKVVRGGAEHQTETSSTAGTLFGAVTGENMMTTKQRVEQTVAELHWEVGLTYKVFVFAGNDPKTSVVELSSRSSFTTIVTTGEKKVPFPAMSVHPPLDVNLTWLVEQVAPNEKAVGECRFKIDRSDEKCKTPVRNEDTAKALEFMQNIKTWARACSRHLHQRIEREILGKHNPVTAPGSKPTNIATLPTITGDQVFCPIVPLLEDPSERDAPGTATRQESPKSLLMLASPTTSEQSPLLSLGDIQLFLNEQIRSLEAAQHQLVQSYPSHEEQEKLITIQEASLQLLWAHIQELVGCYMDSVFYVEEMLHKQLVAAIGKEIQPQDFDKYMSFHLQKLFAPQFAPKPLCHAIRRPNHYPDGVLSIESGDDKMDPIETIVRTIDGETSPPMLIPINAATSIEMTGDRFLHGWLQHRFESSTARRSFNLVARARQFSSFLLMVGVMAGPNKFNPKHAIILQNKDSVLIPLLLNELPTAKEFKDAIASLSSEQKRFATAFRGMQLESSVFGVCIVQLKPQLEVLLGLPDGALTKEIQLTQDLMSLFVDYQIPSDLLSFDGDASMLLKDKVDAVKGYVKAVLDVIDASKEKQLKESDKLAEMNVNRMFAEAQMVQSTTSDSAEDEDVEFDEMVGSFSPATSSPQAKKAMFKASAKGQMMAMAALADGAPPVPAPGGRAAHVGQRRRAAQAHYGSAPAPPPSIADQAAQITPPVTQEFQSTIPAEGDKSLSIDFTSIPKQLDAKFERYDSDSSLRATIIEAGKRWSRKRQENLLTKIMEKPLMPDDIKTEKNKAFDLLDALSRSGSLPIACAELHVVVAVTHCFENDVMGTVIQDNINPIEKVERSSLMIASTVHGCNVADLIEDASAADRLTATFPALFDAPAEN